MNKILSFLMGAALLCASSVVAFAQGYEVKGVVSDSVGPVIGATVMEQGTSTGTSTSLDGEFSLVVSSKDALIEISCIGYTSQVYIASQMPKSIVLAEDALFLDDVVVIGYGTVKKSDLTGSVSTVEADQVNKGVITSPSQMLAGKAGGVVVTAGSGQPGSAATIRIRGGSSLTANNDPMIIIDGLPISNTGISGVSDQLSSINPNDIESFTVLKDASATAIYGSRASNGVIIITTKKGKKTDKGIHVSADFTASISQNTKYLDVLTGDEMRSLMAEIVAAGEIYSAALDALGNAYTDWQKQIYQLGQTYEGNVSLSGNFSLGKAGSLPYRVSGGYYDQTGTLKTSALQRGTLSVALSPSLLDNHLNININAKTMFMHNRFANQDAITAAVQYDPTQTVYSDSATSLNGYTCWNGPTPGVQGTSNPVALLYDKDDQANANRFIGNIQVDYKIHGLEDLHLNLNLGLDQVSSAGYTYIDACTEQSYRDTTQNGNGLDSTYTNKKKDSTLEFYANYAKEFGGKHSFSAMLGYSWQHFYEDSSSEQYSVANPDVCYYSGYPAFEYFLVSFFGRLNYSYDNRFLVTASARYDGTSRFVNHKWGFFPSVALAWNLKNEDFMAGAANMSAFKLRLSWGQTGQQDLNTSNYPSLATYVSNDYAGSRYYFGSTLVTPLTPQAYNEDLKWETTTSYNIGVDLGWLDDRIKASVDAYYRVTTDLLNNTPIAAGANLKNYMVANIGTLDNYGVELDMNFIPVSTKDWFWEIGLNGAWNKNVITKLTTNDENEDYTGVATGGISGGTGNTVQRYMTGYAANAFYVYQQIYDENGNPIVGAYVDRNGDGTIDESDMYCYKKPAADVTLGFNTTVSYKKWTLAVSAHANFGNWVYNNNASNMCLISDLWTNNFVSNRLASEVAHNFTSAQYLSDYWVQNASFLKIDNITLSRLINIKDKYNLNVFATVSNVATITGYDGMDPEVFGGIDNNLWPRPTTYILGVKFNF